MMKTMVRKLGKEYVALVRKAFQEKPNNFGFIKISDEELANLEALFVPGYNEYHSDVFSFRAGIWVVQIVTHRGSEGRWVEVALINPYDPHEVYTTGAVE